MKNPKLNELQQNWLLNASIESIQKKLNNEELTSRELVLMYMDRIAFYNNQINAVLEVNPDAHQIAESLDTERKENGPRGPMHGIPVLIKDNISTNDKMHTSAGSLAIADNYATKDAFVTKQLRNAGAIILGKTNMTEWANFMTQGMPSGYSSRGGQVKNPYGEFDCGGSSSGSGSAISANFATVAVGTETSGSILSPASQNSLVGIKPTVGLISRAGIIPISHTQDTAGPMTKTVKDAAILLNTITGIDQSDPITKTSTEWSSFDFTTVLDTQGLKGAKIGIAREFYFDFLSDDKKEVLEEAIKELERQGAQIKDITIPTTNEKWSYDVLTYEFKVGINAYLKEYTDQYHIRSLNDIINYNFKHSDAMLKYGQSVLLESEKTSGNLTETDYLISLEKDQYLAKEGGIDDAINEHQLDAIVFPNNFGASIPAKAGYPSVTVPAGYSAEGEPVGITFTGSAYSEATLLKLAYAYEQGSLKRKNPSMDE